MSDKGVINTRKASVTFTVEYNGRNRDIVLKPGANRLSEEQYAALRKNPLFVSMFRHQEKVERVTVPDAKNPGEMTVKETRRKEPPKFREEDPGNMDDVKDHTKGEGAQASSGGGGGKSNK